MCSDRRRFPAYRVSVAAAAAASSESFVTIAVGALAVVQMLASAVAEPFESRYEIV